MTAVQSLCIHPGRFESLDEAAVVDLISSFNKLKQFQLFNCTFSTPHQLSLALSAASRLECLELHSARLVQPSSFLARLRNPAWAMQIFRFTITPRSVPNQLTILKISGYAYMDAFLEWLPPVDVLFFNNNLNSLRSLSRLMSRIGSSLTNFVIGCELKTSIHPVMAPGSTGAFYFSCVTESCYSNMTAACGRYLDLGHNNHLRSIRSLCIYGVYQCQIARIISQVPSSRLEQISLYGMTPYTTRLDWDAVGRVLAGPTLSQLQRVNVQMQASILAQPEVCEWILRRLAERSPAARPRDVFHITIR